MESYSTLRACQAVQRDLRYEVKDHLAMSTFLRAYVYRPSQETAKDRLQTLEEVRAITCVPSAEAVLMFAYPVVQQRTKFTRSILTALEQAEKAFTKATAAVQHEQKKEMDLLHRQETAGSEEVEKCEIDLKRCRCQLAAKSKCLGFFE